MNIGELLWSIFFIAFASINLWGFWGAKAGWSTAMVLVVLAFWTDIILKGVRGR